VRSWSMGRHLLSHGSHGGSTCCHDPAWYWLVLLVHVRRLENFQEIAVRATLGDCSMGDTVGGVGCLPIYMCEVREGGIE
jgi:hypothetical protein